MKPLLKSAYHTYLQAFELVELLHKNEAEKLTVQQVGITSQPLLFRWFS